MVIVVVAVLVVIIILIILSVNIYFSHVNACSHISDASLGFSQSSYAFFSPSFTTWDKGEDDEGRGADLGLQWTTNEICPATIG